MNVLIILGAIRPAISAIGLIVAGHRPKRRRVAGRTPRHPPNDPARISRRVLGVRAAIENFQARQFRVLKIDGENDVRWLQPRDKVLEIV